MHGAYLISGTWTVGHPCMLMHMHTCLLTPFPPFPPPQSFVVIAFLVLLNIFLAIMVDAYFNMREELAHLMKRGAPEELTDYAMQTCNRYR
jgi:hypothetical protein